MASGMKALGPKAGQCPGGRFPRHRAAPEGFRRPGGGFLPESPPRSPILLAISELETGRFVECNEALARTIGDDTADQVRGRLQRDLLGPPETRKLADSLNEVAGGAVEVRGRLQDGGTVTVRGCRTGECREGAGA